MQWYGEGVMHLEYEVPDMLQGVRGRLREDPMPSPKALCNIKHVILVGNMVRMGEFS